MCWASTGLCMLVLKACSFSGSVCMGPSAVTQMGTKPSGVESSRKFRVQPRSYSTNSPVRPLSASIWPIITLVSQESQSHREAE